MTTRLRTQGGYRVTAFVAGGINVLPASVRGTNFTGMMHAADWMATLASANGVAAFTPAPDTGIVPLDSFNLWPALSGRNLTSPRTEMVLAVTNRFFNKSLGDVGVQAARFGNWKLILGTDCNTKTQHQPWPELANTNIAFGLSGGVTETGTDHARAPLLPNMRTNGEHTAPDPTCAHGVQSRGQKEVCCAATCGVCGGPNCGQHPGGADACCVGKILAENVTCAVSPAPCVLGPAPAKERVCLFDLANDIGETINLAEEPKYAHLIEQLTARLAAAAETGPDIRIAFADVGRHNATVDHETCAQEQASGYLEPIDWKHPAE